MSDVAAMVVSSAGAAPVRERVDLGPLRDDEVEIAVEHVGLCHSDLSMAHNEWGNARFPFVGGHEVVGTITAVGPAAIGREVGQRVGLGWISSTPLGDPEALAGRHHLARGNEATIIGRPGGFAERVRCQWTWALPLPEGLDASAAGPLFCGGITVFQPIVDHGLVPTQRAAVLGIGGLGHLAVKFLRAWGCEVTAFTSTAKMDEARELGAHHVVDSRDSSTWKPFTRAFDLMISTVNVPMDWDRLMRTVRPHGALHSVGVQTAPYELGPMSMMGQQKLSSSGVGDPATMATMLEFCARHDILPQVEHLPMSQLGTAFERLERGDVRYRFVLDNDL